MSIEPRIQEIGHQLISGKRRLTVNFQGWSQTLVNGMMEHEEFRVASLRFTDVAPTLQDDKQFMDHLTAYFKDGGFMNTFIGVLLATSDPLYVGIVALGLVAVSLRIAVFLRQRFSRTA